MNRNFVYAMLFGGAALCNLSAQQIVASVEWERLYRDSACNFSSVIQTADGGYILGGGIYDIAFSLPPGESYATLVKIDATGEVEWEKKYGVAGTGSVASLVQTRDGGYVFAAPLSAPPSNEKESPHFGRLDAWIVKVDAAGNKQWDRSFGGTADDRVASIRQASDGGYILAGDSESPHSGNKDSELYGSGDGWLLKLDAQGNKQWERSFGDEDSNAFTSVAVISNGGCVVAGRSQSSSSPSNTDGWVIKVGPEGEKQWERFFGGTEFDTFLTIDATRDGGFFLGGSSASPRSGNKDAPHFGGMDFWLVKVNSTGRKQWDRSYGTPGGNELVRVVRQTSDGGCVLSANSRIIKVDSQGRQEWQNLFGDTKYDVFEVWDLRQTKEGGYVVCGDYHNALANRPLSGCDFPSWVTKLEPVPSLAGEAVIWAAEAGMILESVDALTNLWQINESDVLAINGVNAVPIIYSGQQRYYRLRASTGGGNIPSLSLGALLSWPVHTDQTLEFSFSTNGPWQLFSGRQGPVAHTNYAVIPENMKKRYFRARKNAVPVAGGSGD